jgi:hypothetical protein
MKPAFYSVKSGFLWDADGISHRHHLSEGTVGSAAFTTL